jgi:hypothetical protein
LAADQEFLRPTVEAVLQELLEAEMTEALGAEKRERTPARLGYRSGYYGRMLVTRVGTWSCGCRRTAPAASRPSCSNATSARRRRWWRRSPRCTSRACRPGDHRRAVRPQPLGRGDYDWLIRSAADSSARVPYSPLSGTRCQRSARARALTSVRSGCEFEVGAISLPSGATMRLRPPRRCKRSGIHTTSDRDQARDHRPHPHVAI